ncbi:MAG: DUF58 domain-containing protein [Candidatus Pristimantibacillus sp.]
MIVFWFAVIAIILLLLQSKLFNRYALRHIGYKRQFQKSSCFRGEQIELIEQLSNEKWLPVPWLRVESQLSSKLIFQHQDNLDVSSGELSQNHKSFFTLMPYTKITRRHRIICSKRGWYKLQSVSLTGGDLLGLNQQLKQILLQGELIVYPVPAEVPVNELPSHSWQGDISVRRWIIEDPFVITGARDYRSGDTYKQVNWKATARAGRLQVHQYDFTADRKLMIYLNVEDKDSMWRTVTNADLIEQGIEWAAGAAQTVIQSGMEVGFGANMPLISTMSSIVVPPRSGSEHLYDLFEIMAKLEITRTELFSDLLEREAASGYSQRDVLVISTYWSEQMAQHAERLRANGNEVVVWQLLDNEEAREQEGAAG